jgi:DNA-binding response OmpR family regulator
MTVKKTILCVDDEHSLSIHKLTLKTWGYRVLTCGTAAEAMELLAKGGVDLVLCNLELLHAPSPELVTRMTAQCAQTPLMLLSSSKRPCPTDTGVDVWQKGTPPAELLGRIRQLLSKRRGSRRVAQPSAFPLPPAPCGAELLHRTTLRDTAAQLA